MGTTEIIIVFSALMALIALVTIGIDWIGKPLKHRRFIPRMYRFEDEKVPVDLYGNPALGPGQPAAGPGMVFVPMPAAAPPAPMPMAPAAPAIPAAAATVHRQPAPVVVARVGESGPQHAVASTDTHLAPASVSDGGGRGGGAFTGNLDAATNQHAAVDADLAGGWLSSHPSSEIAWSPGYELDATVGGEKPNLATKAERFWMTTAAGLTDSHFSADNIERMADGKAPRRSNPRTGRTEAMQLTGLRQASDAGDVRMRWPGESVDPWNAT